MAGAYQFTNAHWMRVSEFNLLDRQRLKHWQSRFNQQLDSAADLLLPDSDSVQPGV